MEQAGMRQGKQSADVDVMDGMRAMFGVEDLTGRMQVDYAHHGLHVSIDTPLSDLVEGLLPPEGRT